MPYGMENMTVGQLKDKVANMHLQEQQIQQGQTEMMADKRMLADFVDAMGEIPPEASAVLEQFRQARASREGRLLVEAMPEWKDNNVYLEQRKSMGQLAGRYGFSDDELKGLVDHRLIKLVRDFSELDKKVKGASKPKPEKRQKAKPPQKNRQSDKDRLDNLINKAKSSQDKSFKQAAIAKLLGT